MRRILDIAAKDLMQLLRDRKTFLFLLIMPILFTFLFGYAFGGFSKSSDPRLPVGFVDEDDTWLSRDLVAQLANSEVVRLQEFSSQGRVELEAQVADEEAGSGDYCAAWLQQTNAGGQARPVDFNWGYEHACRQERGERSADGRHPPGKRCAHGSDNGESCRRTESLRLHLRASAEALGGAAHPGERDNQQRHPGGIRRERSAGAYFSRNDAAIRHCRAADISIDHRQRAQVALIAAAADHCHIARAYLARAFPGDLCYGVRPVHRPAGVRPVHLEDQLPGVSAGNPSGGIHLGAVHCRPGLIDRDAGAHRGAGDHLFAGADVCAGGAGGRLGAAGSDRGDVRGDRAPVAGSVGNGRVQERIAARSGSGGGSAASSSAAGVCASVLCHRCVEIPGKPGTLGI